MPAIGRITTGLAVAILCTAQARIVSADLVKLRAGGEIRGKLRGGETPLGEKRVVVETLSGSVIAVARQEVRFITRRSLVVEEYETAARRIPHTIEAHARLADWCREHGLQRQRETHLRKILEINPDHRRTRLALGYGKYDGKWMTRDEWNRSRGLVKYKGRYITPEELELIRKSQAELEREREWFRKVRLWKTWLRSQNAERRSTALDLLQKTADPDAVSALARNFGDEPDKRLRSLYVAILSRIKGPKPVPALVALALHDPDYEIRYAALNAIAADQFPTATRYFIRELKDDSVIVIRRAAEGLKRVGDERAIPALIDALSTTHRYKVRVADTRNTMSFGTNGSFAPGQSALPPQLELMLRTGQFPNGVIVNYPQLNQMRRTRIVNVRLTHHNRQVLAALEHLTGQSFGYNERDWRLWLASSKSGGAKTP